MKQTETEYYAEREEAERAAAEKAVTPEARRAHEELAKAYALRSKPDADIAQAG